MNVSYYIAKRYLRSKSSNNAINFISYIAIAGIILGSASLFLVLSGFAGLKDFTLEFSTIIDPDLKAETRIGKSFALSPEQEQKLQDMEGLASYSKVIEARVFASFDGNRHPAYIKGVDAAFSQVNTVDSIIPFGSWLHQGTSQIVVGFGVSNHLSVGVLDYGKRVSLFVPKAGKGQITSTKQAFKQVQAVNVGIFDINPKLNESHIYASIDLARDLLSFAPNEMTHLEFKLTEQVDEATVKSEIQAVLGDDIRLRNRSELNDALNKMLNTENLMVYLIFTLVLIIAFFNVVGSLIMMILDKKKSLNTLFNLGVTLKKIRGIFFLQGSLMSIIGGLIGLVLSILLVFLQQEFSLVYITADMPYPVRINIENIFIAFFTISILGVIASKIASVRISKDMIKTS